MCQVRAAEATFDGALAFRPGHNHSVTFVRRGGILVNVAGEENLSLRLTMLQEISSISAVFYPIVLAPGESSYSLRVNR
jgi:hypothetical protein